VLDQVSRPHKAGGIRDAHSSLVNHLKRENTYWQLLLYETLDVWGTDFNLGAILLELLVFELSLSLQLLDDAVNGIVATVQVELRSAESQTSLQVSHSSERGKRSLKVGLTSNTSHARYAEDDTLILSKAILQMFWYGP